VLQKSRRILTSVGRRRSIRALGGFGAAIPIETLIQAEWDAAGWTMYGLFLARLSDVTLVSTKVSVWNNLGTGGNATQGVDATRPTWTASGAIGTGASLAFSAQRLVTAAIDMSSDTAFAVTAFWKDQTATTVYTHEIGNGSVGVGILGPGVNVVAGNIWGQARTSTVARCNSATDIPKTNASVSTLTWDSALAASECQIRDAGADVTLATSPDGNNAAPSLNDTFTIGSRTDGTSAMIGDIAAVCVAAGTTAIPTTQLANVEALLLAEWGL